MFNHVMLVAHENGSGRQTFEKGGYVGDTVVSSEWEGAGEDLPEQLKCMIICLYASIFFGEQNLFNSESCCM